MFSWLFVSLRTSSDRQANLSSCIFLFLYFCCCFSLLTRGRVSVFFGPGGGGGGGGVMSCLAAVASCQNSRWPLAKTQFVHYFSLSISCRVFRLPFEVRFAGIVGKSIVGRSCWKELLERACLEQRLKEDLNFVWVYRLSLQFYSLCSRTCSLSEIWAHTRMTTKPSNASLSFVVGTHIYQNTVPDLVDFLMIFIFVLDCASLSGSAMRSIGSWRKSLHTDSNSSPWNRSHLFWKDNRETQVIHRQSTQSHLCTESCDQSLQLLDELFSAITRHLSRNTVELFSVKRHPSNFRQFYFSPLAFGRSQTKHLLANFSSAVRWSKFSRFRGRQLSTSSSFLSTGSPIFTLLQPSATARPLLKMKTQHQVKLHKIVSFSTSGFQKFHQPSKNDNKTRLQRQARTSRSVAVRHVDYDIIVRIFGVFLTSAHVIHVVCVMISMLMTCARDHPEVAMANTRMRECNKNGATTSRSRLIDATLFGWSVLRRLDCEDRSTTQARVMQAKTRQDAGGWWQVGTVVHVRTIAYPWKGRGKGWSEESTSKTLTDCQIESRRSSCWSCLLTSVRTVHTFTLQLVAAAWITMKSDFFRKLQQFDAYPKTLEDFRVKTFAGAAGESEKCLVEVVFADRVLLSRWLVIICHSSWACLNLFESWCDRNFLRLNSVPNTSRRQTSTYRKFNSKKKMSHQNSFVCQLDLAWGARLDWYREKQQFWLLQMTSKDFLYVLYISIYLYL